MLLGRSLYVLPLVLCVPFFFFSKSWKKHQKWSHYIFPRDLHLFVARSRLTKKKKKGRDSRVGKYRRRHTHDDRRIIEFLVVSIAVRNVYRGVQSYFFGMPAGCEVCRGIRHRTGTRLCGLATNDDYAPWCGNFAGNPEGLPTVEKKNEKKVRKWRADATSALTI